MKTYMHGRVGVAGAAVLGLCVWVVRVAHGAPGTAGCPGKLLHGADEYRNSDYPEGIASVALEDQVVRYSFHPQDSAIRSIHALANRGTGRKGGYA